MSDETWRVIIGAIALGVVQVIIAWRTSAKSDANRAATAAQLAPIATDAKVIVGHVNSEATRMQGEKDALQKENALLREVITKQDEDKALLAQAVATRAIPSEPATGAIVVTDPAESLTNVDTTTKAIEKNTAATRTDVKKLKRKE